MSLALLGARLLLAGVFAAAGFAKLADREGSRRAVAEFGVPRRLAWLIGSLLPLAELATAGALLPPFSATWGALAAVALLLSFSAAIAFNLARGRTPECRCFGQVHSAPVSWRMVARNLALAVVAAAVVAGEGVVAVGAVAALAVVLLAREAPALAEGLAVWTSAPRFESLPELLAPGRPVLLVFASQNCGPCLALAPELEQWRREHAERLTISVLEREDEGVEAIFEAYKVDATPAAVLVGADGRIASGVAPGATAIRRLVTGEPAEATEGMRRGEFLLRLVGTTAAISALFRLPARALAAAPCPPRRIRCGEDCVNRMGHEGHCGGCNTSCIPGRACARGECKKGDGTKCTTGLGQVCCKGKPITLKNDKANCGECGNVCAGQRPRCCSGFCKDVATDRAFCGDCDTICPDNSICVNGKCKECTKPLKRCGNKCGSERLERCCGERLYDKAAYAGDVCCKGKMVKPIQCGGKSACPGTCCKGKIVDTLNDPKNCGPSCEVCGSNARCCNGKCVDISADPKNCNGCGKPCKKFEVCRFHDGCICPLGAECAPPLPHP